MTEFYFTGNDLIEMGFTPGPKFGDILKDMNSALAANRDASEDECDAAIAAVIKSYKDQADAEEAHRLATMMPMLSQEDAIKVVYNIDAVTDDEKTNLEGVRKAMDLLVRTPTVVAAAVMPDACPAGAIPVGGVAGARNAIHPGWHSADICCSMFATDFGDADPKSVLDAIYNATHFGPGGRNRAEEAKMPEELLAKFLGGNPFFESQKLQVAARSHLTTQGDGNHFAFVGISEKTGHTWLITHHGSRGMGAHLYKAGMLVAEDFRQKICPELDKGHAFIPFDTQEGRDYWEALQVVREWTKLNHSLLHKATSDAIGIAPLYQRWNEHNFVFKDGEVFWHAKGATPVYSKYLPDTDGTQIVPMNMAQPILFVQGTRHEGNHGFAPHGAGRNMSRTQHKKRMAGETDQAIFDRETAGLDVRFKSGNKDISELPSAYKDADAVQEQMNRFDLATIVERIQPYGSIMAGDVDMNATWKKKADAKKAARKAAEVEPQSDSVEVPRV
jgi:RNA-splicing ligase RtcB